MSSGTKRPYRLGILIWSLRLYVALMCILTPLLVLVMLLFRDDADGQAVSLTDRMVGAVGVLVVFGGLTAHLWAMSRIGIYVQGDHVVVRTYVRTTRYRWADIARFDDAALRDFRRGIARRLAGRRARCVRLHLTDGREVPVTLVHSGTTALGTKPAEIARRLEAARPSGREPR